MFRQFEHLSEVEESAFVQLNYQREWDQGVKDIYADFYDTNKGGLYGIDSNIVTNGSWMDVPISTPPVTVVPHDLTITNKRKLEKNTTIPKKRRKKEPPQTLKDFVRGKVSNSETGYRGVRFSTNGRRFRATVNVKQKSRNVGTFDTAEAAARAYDVALVACLQGEVTAARLNFPEMLESYLEHNLHSSIEAKSSVNSLQEKDYFEYDAEDMPKGFY